MVKRRSGISRYGHDDDDSPSPDSHSYEPTTKDVRSHGRRDENGLGMING